MTIFLEIITKELLLPEIKKLYETSISEDNSYANLSLTFFNLGRERRLSVRKQELMDQLKQQLTALKDHDTDSETCNEIHNKIKLCLEGMTAARKEIDNSDPSTTEDGIEKLDLLTSQIFKKLSELDVLNINYDKNPLNCFRYYVALYCTKKIVDAQQIREESTLKRMIRNPHFTRYRLLTAEKEKLIMLGGGKDSVSQQPRTIIKACEIEVRKNYDRDPNEVVVEFMSKLQDRNLQLHSDHGFDLGVSPNFSLFLPQILPQTQFLTIKPDGGFLGKCLIRATHEINENTTPVITPSQLRTSQDGSSEGRISELSGLEP